MSAAFQSAHKTKNASASGSLTAYGKVTRERKPA